MNRIKNITLILSSLVLISCGDSSGHTDVENINSTIKKTAQTKSYDENGEIVNDDTLKDDGFYQKGVTPKYTRDDYTQIVTDHITGLEWEDTLAVSSEVKKWVNDEIYNKCRYVFGNQKCEEDESCDICFDTSGDTATSYCEALDLDGRGWRLPTVSELFSIVDKSKTNPAIDSKFENTNNDRYYTSTIVNWFLPITVYFREGYSVIYFPKISAYNGYVRCVRGDETNESNNNFIRIEQGVVQDRKTKLEWQDNYSNNSENIKEDSWKNAINYCESLDLNGSNWRLPNVNELNTIFDKKGELVEYFKIGKDKSRWWSSTTYGGSMGGVLPGDNQGLNSLAWVVSGYKTHYYFTNGESKDRVYNIRCVRELVN